MLALLCFLFTISSSSTTDIFEIPDETVPKLHIVSDKNLDRIERIYLQNKMKSDTLNADDPVCSLPKGEKIALCQQIFEQRSYNDLGIYLNKIAFSIATPTCKEAPLRFKTFLNFPDDKVTQKMYPCHGRHDPIRTSFVEDNYYAKYYVSAGPVENSVMVYVYEYNAVDDWYNIFDYLRNVALSELPDKFIEIAEVTEELELNKDDIWSNNPKELEYTFIREYKYMPKVDPICNLELTKKIALCQFIFSHHFYRNFLGITLNRNDFYNFEPTCEERRLTIRYFSGEKDRYVIKIMLPCFGRSHFIFGNVLEDGYVDHIYVSSGPRKHSLFVYVHKDKHRNPKHHKFYILDMVENFNLKHLDDVRITVEDAEKESLTTRMTLRKLNEYDYQIHKLQREISLFTTEKNKLSGMDDIRRLDKKIETLQKRLNIMQEKFDAVPAADSVKASYVENNFWL